MLRWSLSAARRASGSVLSPSPKSRSNTMRGFTSTGSGVVALRQETVLVYAQLYPESQPPARDALSRPSSGDPSCVLLPSSLAAIWSADTPARLPAPSVFLGGTPVSQDA